MANSPASAQHDDDVLRDGFELGFTYTRSVGPVIGAFLTGLRGENLELDQPATQKTHTDPTICLGTDPDRWR